MKKLFSAMAVIALTSLGAGANDTLLKFNGGIGVIPAGGVVQPDGQPLGSPGVVKPNIVRGFFPPGAPWRINSLKATVKVDGHINLTGTGLLLAGGDKIGTTAGVSVRASVVCGTSPLDTTDHETPSIVQLSPEGDFAFDEVLDSANLTTCVNPTLVIFNPFTAQWLAAGILSADNTH
jgi:hypothetical protein